MTNVGFVRKAVPPQIFSPPCINRHVDAMSTEPPEGVNYYDWLTLEQEVEKALRSRKEKRVAEKLLKEMPEVEPSKEGGPADIYFKDRLAVTRESVDHLRQEIETRVELHDYFLAKLDYQITEAAFSLSQLSPWGIGYNRGVDLKRNFLERQLAQFRKELRDTELKAWEDIVQQRQELREALKEYRELRRRYRLLRGGGKNGD